MNNDSVTYEQVGFIWRPKWGNEKGRNGESIWNGLEDMVRLVGSSY